MKTYKFWKKEITEIRIDGQSQSIVCFGRSNMSLADAAADAVARAKKVEMKIAGKEVKEEDYSADIREELAREIDAHNVITRNRYGALVWNTDAVTIIDIDQHQKTFLESLGLQKRDSKTAIVEAVEKLAAKPPYSALCLRVYETKKGIRVIVDGTYYDPNSAEGKALLQACNADRLYSLLCRKQKCYRARLTPKPHRIKQKGIKYRWPMEAMEYESAKKWVSEYNAKSEKFAVCRYLKTLGKTETRSPVISLHDELTKAVSQLPLA